MQMNRVAGGIYQIDAETGVPASCSCYLVEAEKTALVETGPACQVPAIKEALGARKLSYIISTHAHVDHAGGLGQMLADSPDAVVVAHEEAVRHLVDPRRLVEGIKQVFGDDFEQVYGAFLPVPADRVLPVRDGTVLSLGDRELRVVHTPGHVSHHISVIDPLTQCLFVGDALGGNLGGGGFGPPVAPPGYDMEVALETTAKLKGLGAKLLCLAHYGTWTAEQGLPELVEQTTRSCADIVLRAAKAGESAAQIGRRIRDHLCVTDLAWLAVDALMVPGFLHYFRKKGLITA